MIWIVLAWMESILM